MGYIRHDAILVTHWNEDFVVESHEKAIQLGLPCSNIVESIINGYTSFLIAPDGSKEGWPDSSEGDIARNLWIEWAQEKLKEREYFVDWVHISYGGDEPEYTKIVKHNKHIEDQ